VRTFASSASRQDRASTPAPGARVARALRPVLAVSLALAAWSAVLTSCATPSAGALPAGAVGLSEAAGRETLARMARAVRGERWIEAWTLLSARWRAAATPARLAADYRGAGPVAREAADRVLALLASGAPLVTPGPGRLELPAGPGRAARLVAEGGAWRVDALE
jgi:hypothetical protein